MAPSVEWETRLKVENSLAAIILIYSLCFQLISIKIYMFNNSVRTSGFYTENATDAWQWGLFSTECYKFLPPSLLKPFYEAWNCIRNNGTAWGKTRNKTMMKASLANKHQRGLWMSNKEFINQIAASSQGQWTCNSQNQTPGDREVPVPRTEGSLEQGFIESRAGGSRKGCPCHRGQTQHGQWPEGL